MRQFVNFSGANLRRACLYATDLRDANFTNANLEKANLAGADLRQANFSGVDLSSVNLKYCVGNGIEINSLQLGRYSIVYYYTNNKIMLSVNSLVYPLKKWKKDCCLDEEITKQWGANGLKWWHNNKKIIFKIIKQNPPVKTN